MNFEINLNTAVKDSKYSEKNYLQNMHSEFISTIENPKIGFYSNLENKEYIDSCKKIYEQFKNIKTFYHIGIGGSSLGPEMLNKALSKDQNIKFEFINNIDPDALNQQISNIDIESSLFFFVSKSGGTAETLATFAIVSQILINKNIPKEDFTKFMVFATDPVKSQLKDIAKELSISTLEIPSNVGGRFSVLTPVGLFPSLFCGINIDKLINGAIELKTKLTNEDVNSNILLQCTSQILSLKDEGFNQTVMMPYSSLLREFGSWFVQIWAESLGKKHDTANNIVHTGLTPIPAYGATDQHSQMQLIMEGPFDKVLFLLEVDKFKNEYSLENTFKQPALTQLSSYNLSQLFKAELHGSMKALKESNRPFIHFKIEQLDEYHLGALILFFECLTVTVGNSLNVDPFDQPGVELGKKYAYEFLGQL